MLILVMDLVNNRLFYFELRVLIRGSEREPRVANNPRYVCAYRDICGVKVGIRSASSNVTLFIERARSVYRLHTLEESPICSLVPPL